MTEAEWADDSYGAQGMLMELSNQGKATRTKVGRRKLRLFAAACCRRIWRHLEVPGAREAVEVAERFAEGQASKDDLNAARARIDNLPIRFHSFEHTPKDEQAG